ncbi:restriction endonuclease subunit S [Elizabethkingia anophelis]|uniref:restriction endonuclease subunit S n=1 Tax=Elizabethkingia anophelis TaxID=1117645 RepID=UPI00301D57E7
MYNYYQQAEHLLLILCNIKGKGIVQKVKRSYIASFLAYKNCFVNSNKENIPKHWKWVVLDDIGIVVSGGTPSTKKSEYWNGNIPWITPADLSNHEEAFISKGKRNISQEGLDSSSAYLLPENSIVFSSRAPIGYVAITKSKLATNQGFKNLILFSNLINPKYVYYYLKTVKNLAEEMASGTTFLELSATKFKQIPFPLTSIEEQNRIVERIEELLSELEKANSDLKNAQIKTSLLLKKILNEGLSKINSKFKNYSLNEICENITDGSHFSPKTVVEGEPYITVRDIHNDRINFENCKRISIESFQELKKNGCSPRYNDVLFSKDGTVGKVLLNDYKQEFVVLSSLAILTPKKDIVLPKYLYYYLKSDLFLNQALTSKKGVAIKRVVLRDLKELALNIPLSIDEQLNIVDEIEEKLANTNILLDEIKLNIESNNFLYRKILREAFQGKLSKLLNVDTFTDVLIGKINKEKEQYLSNKQIVIKERPKTKRMGKEKLSIIEILKQNKKAISSKQLWKDSMYSDDIERFYLELKKNQDKIIEEKTEKGSLISLR